MSQGENRHTLKRQSNPQNQVQPRHGIINKDFRITVMNMVKALMEKVVNSPNWQCQQRHGNPKKAPKGNAKNQKYSDVHEEYL